jgi:hypothetical protein
VVGSAQLKDSRCNTTHQAPIPASHSPMKIPFQIFWLVGCVLLTNGCSTGEKQRGMRPESLQAKAILVNKDADMDQREQAIQKLRNLNDWRTLLESVPTIMGSEYLVMQILNAVVEIGDPDAKSGVLRVRRLYLKSNSEPSGMLVMTMNRAAEKFERFNGVAP